MTGARFAPVLLALGVVGAVGMMIVPLPTWSLDLLLTMNVSVAAVLLLVSLYIPGIRALSSLPSLLLLTTLFRLALNVSTTRLILLDADAGRVIEAFGTFVVQGSVIVGAVVFLILTLIQFVVIAQGSERVAEVAARFSLDAMPGRQMAIDADLRSGAVGLKEAQRLRVELQRESQLYGAMDGAMKFVKGDAVAGVVIIAVNIVGGLAIGVFQRDMGLVDAAQTYALLTIGDGLISQIPALLTATAAGIAVTRVASRDEHLGSQIARQVLARPHALMLASALLVVLAVMPGLPWWPFMTLAVVVGALGWWAQRRASTAPSEAPPDGVQPAPLMLRVGVSAGVDASGLMARWEVVAQEIEQQTGVQVPELRIEVVEGEGGFVVLVDEVPALRGQWGEDQRVDRALAVLDEVVRGHLGAFLGLQEVQRMLDGLRQSAPADVEAVVPRLLSLPELTSVLRGLVEEGVSVRHLRTILGAMALEAPHTRARGPLVEAARASLKRVITHAVAPEGASVSVVLVEREIEEMVRSSLREGPRGVYLSLAPELSRQIESAASRTLPEEARPVVLTAPDVRAHLRRVLARVRADVVVVSHDELMPELHVAPLGRLSVRSGG